MFAPAVGLALFKDADKVFKRVGKLFKYVVLAPGVTAGSGPKPELLLLGVALVAEGVICRF